MLHNKHIVMILYLNSPYGELNHHIIDTIKFLVENNIQVTVICKDYTFRKEIEKLKVNYLAIDFENIDYDINYIISKLDRPHVIHTYFLKAKDIAIKLSRYYKIPLMITVSTYNDNSIKLYEKDIYLFISVSEFIKQYLIQKNIDPKRIITITNNGIDINKLKNLSDNYNFKFNKNHRNILTVSRFDEDEKFIIDSIVYCLEKFLEKKFFEFNWIFIGDGNEIEKLKNIATKINTQAKREVVKCLGWKEKEFILNLYKNCDIFVGSGKNVIEAMSFSKPVIVIGSEGYIGIINDNSYLDAIYTNFSANFNKQQELLYNDLDNILTYSNENLNSLGQISYFICKTFFDSNDINKKLLNIYNLMFNIKSNSYKQNIVFEKLNILLNDFNHYFIKGEATKEILNDKLKLIANTDKPLYLINGSKTINDIPSNKYLFTKDEINLKLDVHIQNIKVNLFIIEFNEKKKIFAKSYSLDSGVNNIIHYFNKNKKYMKIAFRIEALNKDNYFYLSQIKLKNLERKEYIPHIKHIENDIFLKKGKYTYSFDTKYNKYIYFANYKPNKKIIISFNGAVDRTKVTYNFQRFSWSDDIEYSWIQFTDPTIKEENDLSLGWYQGHKNEFAIDIFGSYIKKLLNKNNINEKDVIFFASSAGGFASLKMANYFNDSKIIVINPQLYLENYPKKPFNKMIEYVYKDSYPNDRINVKIDFEKRKASIFYFQNTEDELHYEPQLKSYLNGLNSNIYKIIKALEDVDCSKKLNVIIYSDKKTGHSPPNKQITLEILNYLIKDIKC